MPWLVTGTEHGDDDGLHTWVAPPSFCGGRARSSMSAHGLSAFHTAPRLRIKFERIKHKLQLALLRCRVLGVEYRIYVGSRVLRIPLLSFITGTRSRHFLLSIFLGQTRLLYHDEQTTVTAYAGTRGDGALGQSRWIALVAMPSWICGSVQRQTVSYVPYSS